MDSIILECINEGVFSQLSALSKFTAFNKEAEYIIYLQKMEELLKAEGYLPDQLELFLFQFGKNLKKNGGNMLEVQGL